MSLARRHLSPAQRADLAEQRLSGEERAPLLAHLVDCRRCATEVAALERLVGLMRSDQGEDAPPHVVARAVNLFQPRTTERPGLRQLLAVLLIDSARQPAPAGLRAGALPVRQLLFRAENYDLDVRIAPAGGRWILSGQVLGSSEAGDVELHGAAEMVTAALNELGEFTLPAVPAGGWTLRLTTTDAEITTPPLMVPTDDESR